MFRKFDVAKLIEKQDIKKLSKLMNHKDPEIRKQSVQALVKLLKTKQLGQEKENQIINSFFNTDEDLIRDILMETFLERKAQKKAGNFRSFYDRSLIWAIYLAKGLPQLIDLNKALALMDWNDWQPNFHQVVSETLLAIADEQGVSIEDLIKIVTYIYSSNTRPALNLEKLIERSDPIQVTQEIYDEVKNNTRRFSPVTMSSLSKINETLLRKMTVAS